MVLKHFFVIAFILLCFKINAQWFGELTELDNAKLMITYEQILHEDSTNIDDFDIKKMILIIGNNISFFQTYSSYESYKIGRRIYEEGGINAVVNWINGGGMMQYGNLIKYSVYKNYPEGKMTTQDNVPFGDNYVYEEELCPFNWQILGDTTHISGYLCQKAICNFGGRTWDAWFSEELPYNDGPYKFCGLPGLILSIADTRNHYSFKFISIELMPEGEKISWEEKDRIKTTKQNFFKVVKTNREAPSVGISADDGLVNKFERVIRSRNNPIELE